MSIMKVRILRRAGEAVELEDVVDFLADLIVSDDYDLVGSPSSSGFTLQDSDGWRVAISGSGFRYAGDEGPSAGRIKTITVSEGRSTVGVIDTDFTVAQLDAAVPADSLAQAVSFLLGFDFDYVSPNQKPESVTEGSTLGGVRIDFRGDDKFVFSARNDVFFAGRGDDSVSGGGGADRLLGGDGNDVLDGGDQNDILRGGRSNDRLQGGNGDDKLYGEAGNDQLSGGGGADRLNGGAGRDALRGGAGADIFEFGPGDSVPGVRDAIYDFERPGAAAGDRIVLSALDADATRAGNQAFAFGTATGVGRLYLRTEGANTVVLGNVDADRQPEFALVLVDGGVSAAAYAASDFVL